MSNLYDELKELVRTRRLWIVHNQTGECLHFPSAEYENYAVLINSGRWVPKMSEKAAAEYSARVTVLNAGRN